MKIEDVKIGMKVIAHSKSIGDDQSSAWSRVKSGASQYLKVVGLKMDDVNDPPREPIILLWDDHPLTGTQLGGDRFLAKDIEPYAEHTSCGMQLTVIFRDDSPMWHANDCPKYRTVRIDLTENQLRKLERRVIGHKPNGSREYEEISTCVLEFKE